MGSGTATSGSTNYLVGAHADRPAPFALDGDELSHLIVLKGMTSTVQYESVGDMPARFLALVTESLTGAP